MPFSSQTFLYCSLFLTISSVFLYYKQNHYWKSVLFSSSILLAAAFALFSPFLYVWDEQFHALVAKNMLHHPFHPMLYAQDPAELTGTNWVDSQTWLHKQPLFLWQMTFSIKLFGTTAFAVRFPSVLLFAFAVLSVFRIGELLFSRTTGFLAALLFMHSAYLLGLISGQLGTDHNDLVFLAYITFSFRTLLEWKASQKEKWLYLTGLFAACAILTKWLVGLLVFSGWGVILLIEFVQHKNFKQFVPFLKTLLTTFLLVLPWQLWIFTQFPQEAAKEFKLSSQHFYDVIENHGGGIDFYWNMLTDQYFHRTDVLLLFLLGLFFLFYWKNDWKNRVFILVPILVVFTFFTLAKTKMPSFTLPVYPLVLQIISYGIAELFTLIRNKKIRTGIYLAIMLIGINLILKPMHTLEQHGFVKNTIRYRERQAMLQQYEFIRNHRNPTGKIVFNCQLHEAAYPSWMFFTEDFAYRTFPEEKKLDKLIRSGTKIVLIDPNKHMLQEFSQKPGVQILHWQEGQ